MGLEVFVPNDITFFESKRSCELTRLRQKHLLCPSRNQFRRVWSKSPHPTPASESYYGPRNEGVHPPGDVNILSLPLLQIIAEWVIQFSRRRALPVANLFSISADERLVKLTRHTESAGRRRSEATSNNHSCMVVNKELGELCPPVADRHPANER